MKHLFSPLLPKDPLQGPVLVLAAHPDDEVIGAGSLLAWHGLRGHAVTVVHATDGAGGDPGNRQDDIRAVRRAEGIEALRRLGLPEPRHWDLPDGRLPEHLAELTARIEQVMREVRPMTLYSFHGGEAHRDHRAVAKATADAAHALPAGCRCLLYGVNFVPSGGTLFDTTDVYPKSYEALKAYASQNAYIDLPGQSEHRERAATVNVDIAGVLYGEMFVDLEPHELPAVHALQDRLHRWIQRDAGGAP
ncbi:MAG TPA: PIG-L family deacetylase [Planctomycetota bacterium]|nr:PIG-L family deacetylase [Planctomycetota bacterium]